MTLTTVLLWCASAIAQDSDRPADPPSQEELLKLMKPGPEHELLTQYAGAWDVTITMGSGAQAQMSQGTAENRMIVDGRFLEIEYEAQGTDTEGAFLLGFDRRHRQFAMVSLDSFGTYFVTSQGPRDPETGKIRMPGKDDDPVMKSMGLAKEFVHVVDFRSLDEFAIEVWFVDTRTPERREFKFMDWTFKRKK